MLHLFNKVYLEFDDRIENHLDRVVISQQYGDQIYDILEKTFLGKLILYGKSFEEVIGDDFLGFIKSLKDFGDESGKKIIIFCDRTSYKKFMAHWFRSTLPNLDFDGFKTIVDHTIYNQRMISNTQLAPLFSVNLNSLWEDLEDIQSAWENAQSVNRSLLKSLNLNHTYEFLLSTYLSGDNSHKESLKKTLHMFLRRWFVELFEDSRQMVLLNITNHKFLSTFNIDPNLIDITQLDPLETIEQLESLGIKKGDYESLYFIKPNKIDVFKFKLDARHSIVNRGFNIILSIGDNLCDIGEYGGEGLLVPVKQS